MRNRSVAYFGTRAAASGDLAAAEAFHWVGEQIFGGFQESHRVGQPGVEFEGGFVGPDGVDRERGRWPDRFEDVEGKAAGLGPADLDDPQQFLTKRSFFAKLGLEADDEMKGHSFPGV
jgi:hypothetical protein